MNYITVGEAAEEWQISERTVRYYCDQGRIDGAILVGGFWIIPSDAPCPTEDKKVEVKLTPLAQKIVYQRDKNNHFGIYEYIQVNLAYSSNRMASNRLTRQQVEEVYRTNKVVTAFEPMKVDDLIEVVNHFACLRYVVDNIGTPLTVSFVKKLHEMMTYGTYTDRKGKVHGGEFRREIGKIGVSPKKINRMLSETLSTYEKHPVGLEVILDLHARKRSNGEGSLHKRSNGLWEWQIMVGYQPDGKRKMKSFYGRTQKEVKEKAAKYLDDLRAAPQIGKEMYFSDWADIWYESIKGQVAEQTYESYQYTLNILKEYFRDDRLIDIRAIDIENFLKKMAEDGRSHSYITKFRGMLFQIMKKAEANDLIRKNPVAYADKQKNTGAKSEKDAFTAEEIRHLMKALPYDRMGMSIRLMLGTGMRTQEIMALEPKHIEKDGSCIHIRQAVTMVKGSPKIGPPKTKTSYRDIPVPSHLREIAKEFRNTSEQFIWHGEDVPICNPSVFRKHFKKALIAVGKVRLLSPHCCRHTYVSQLQAQGVPLETIQSLTGHADVDMTEHYLHVQKEVKEDAAQKLNSLFKKGKPALHIA